MYNNNDDIAHENKLALIWCILSGHNEEINYISRNGAKRTTTITHGASVEDAIRLFKLRTEDEE